MAKTNIIIDRSQQDHNFRMNYNKLAFLVPILIDLMDKISESNVYKHNFKKFGNLFLAEGEKIVKTHFDQYENHGIIEDNVNKVDAKDVYNLSSKAYEEAFDFFTTRKASEISSIMSIIKVCEESGMDLTEYLIEFVPLKK